MPHAIGCIDGKHIREGCRILSGILYSYTTITKGSTVFGVMAICDANCCIILFDLGQYGSNNGEDVWR